MPDDYEDIDLNALSDDELVEQMHNDLYDGMKAEIVEGTNILLGRGFTATKVLDDALVAGMKIVGIDFRDGILFVPEVLLAANAMKAGMEILRPLLAETGAEPVGKVVIGTVKGDIHDIGKNLVGMMLEGAGFEVIDLGINTDADKFIAALEEHKPDILGMSALLTTTMPYMKVVIQTLKDRGIREDYIVLVGGAPLNEEFGMAVGADAYCRDAGIAAETARRLIDERRAAAGGPSARGANCESVATGMRRALRHRLRGAGPRARGRDRRPARRRRRLPLAGPPQPARADPGPGPRPHPRGPRRWLRADLHRVRRLRDRRPARPGDRRGGRRAAGRRPLLRVLRGAGDVRGDGRRRARDLLADRLPRPQLRAARDPRPRHRPPPGARADVLRELPPARLPLADRGRRRCWPWRAQPRIASGSRSSTGTSAWASWQPRSRHSPPARRSTWRRDRRPRVVVRRRRARSSSHSLPEETADGDDDRDLVAGHPGPGHRPRWTPLVKGRPPSAVPGRDRQGREPRREAQLQRLHRGVAEGRPGVRRRHRAGGRPKRSSGSRRRTTSTDSPS